MTSDTTPRPVSPLRARMIEDMTVRGFKEDTRRDYVRHVRAFAAFIDRSPDTATAEDLRLFQLHQTQSGIQPPSINSAVSALRFFFTVTLDRPDLARRLTVVPYPRRIPTVLSVEEVTEVQGGVRHRLRRRSPPPTAPGCASRKWSRSRSAISIPRACCCASSAARGARACPRESGGPPCDAVATAARTAARLVARGAATQSAAARRLAVSRPQPGRAAVGPAALPRCPRRRPGRGDHQARLAAHAAAQLCHAPPRARCRYSGDPDTSRSRDILPANT
jgi:hypothetical protein